MVPKGSAIERTFDSLVDMSQRTHTSEAGLAAVLSGVRELLSSIGDLDVVSLDGASVLAAVDDVEVVRRQVESLASRVVAAVDAHGLWAADGARSLAAWMRNRTGRTDVTTRRELKQARALRDHLPGAARALAAGEIGADHASALVRHTTDTAARRERLQDPEIGEGFLVDQARKLDAGAFTLLVKQWAVRADPEAADRAWRQDLGKEQLFLSRTVNGYDVRGWLSETTGAAFAAALDARVGTPAASDTRTPAQRRAGAVGALSRLALDSGVLRPGSRIRPHLAVTVSFETMQALAQSARRRGEWDAAPPRACDSCSDGACLTCLTAPDPTSTVVLQPGPLAADLVDLDPGLLPDGTPLAPALLSRLACGSALHRVVFGPSSEVLDVGREERLFTAAQTRAIIARDGSCRYPGCHAPPGEGEVHHSVSWWAENGPTDAALGILVCWHHHDVVHARGITIRREDDRWTFRRRDGSEITAYGSAA